MSAVQAVLYVEDEPLIREMSAMALAHLIHRIAGIRERAWYNRRESLRDWLLTPLSSPGQNLPCPPATTIHCSRSPCQTSARRKSPRRSMAERSVPTAVFFCWPRRIGVL